MIITLDYVANILHLLIEGSLLDFEKKVSREHGMNMMKRLLGMSEASAAKAFEDDHGAHITYIALKRLYDEHLTVARQLVVPRSREELQKRERRR